MSSERKYKQFHGFAPTELTSIPWHDPQELVYLGRALAIEYESDKVNGGGDGEPCAYRHEFHKDNILCTDSTGKQLYILGPKLKVEAPGIIN